MAKSRLRLVDDLNNVVVDSLRGTAARKEESRKKHAAFYHKLKSERDRSYAEKDKAKQLYDDACAEIESIKAKISKSSGDVEKLQRQMDACLLDRDNKKVRRACCCRMCCFDIDSVILLEPVFAVNQRCQC